MDESEVRAILAAYDLGRIASVVPLDANPNRPWHVRTERWDYVLREHYVSREPAVLEVEHGLAAALVAGGLPVAQPVPARDGNTWSLHEGRLFALYHFLPGDPFAPGNTAQAGAVGRMLARFHAVSRTCKGVHCKPPAPGFHRMETWIGGINARWPRRAEVAQLVDAYHALDGAITDDTLPEALVMTDFGPINLVFDGDEVSGIFDIDCCYWGPRLTNLASTMLHVAIVCSEDDQGLVTAVDLNRTCARAMWDGYASVEPPAAMERRLLPLALRREVRRWSIELLWEIALRTERWQDHEWAYCVLHHRAVDEACEALAGTQGVFD